MNRNTVLNISLIWLVVCIRLFSWVGAQSISTTIRPVGTHPQQMKQLENKQFQVEQAIQNTMLNEVNQRALLSLHPFSVSHPGGTNFIVFGYQQSDASYDYHYLWPSLTHVGCSFTNFDATGSITNLSSFSNRPGTLKSGGTAQANGVRVIMVIAPSGFASSIQYSVFTSPTIRQTLVNNVVSAVTSDGYCQGVSFDFEPFINNASVRDGITAFAHSLSTTLKNISSNYEVSYYIDAIYSSSEMDVPNIMPWLDYVVYSCYDWSVGVSTPNAVSDVSGYVTQVNNYLNAGVSPNKMVLSISSYGHEWYTTGPTYTSTITSNIGNNGFQDAYYDVTVQPTFSGPYIDNYHTGDETDWYTFNDGVGNRIHVIDNPTAMEYKSRMVQSWRDSSDVNNGKHLRGIAFWSLFWMANGNSYDPISHKAVAKTRYYPQLMQLFEEIFSPPGTRNYIFEKFEGPDVDRDYRWRQNPKESPDNIGLSASTSVITSTPAGSGQPSNSDSAMKITFTFASTSGNKLFYRHEMLNDDVDTTITDTNNARFYVNRNSKIRSYLYSSATYTGKDVRMVVMDTARQLEKSNTYSLTSGWQLMEWDLTDASQISGYTTSEPAFKTGNGTLNASTTGAKDIGFIGWLIEGTNGTGTVYFDEVSYIPTNPDGKNYTVNEFSYGNSTQEFVEIYGPSGALPTGMQLRLYDNFTSQSIFTTINLSGTIADAGGGNGYWVVGDTSVPNVNQIFPNSGVQNMPTTQPGAIQLYNASNGNVYDNVVYQAYGGLGDLIRKQTLGVTQNGYPWIGQVSAGMNNRKQVFSMGRYPDGANTYVNNTDFSFMPPTPGATNGGSVSIGQSFGFSTSPSYAFQTFLSFTILNPTSFGLPASPSGGNAYRCVDTTGGGVTGVIGDAALGAGGAGYSVSGEIYLPISTQSTQANGVGICGRQGTNFFTSVKATLDKSGYESGYWLIYENRAGVGLNDGLADHATTFNFVYAHNDNMDTTKVTLLASVSLASTGATGGAWTTFILSVNPSTNTLIAKINGVTIYNGAIPAGAVTSGAFEVGFRENGASNPSTVPSEGTWIDNLLFSNPL